MDQLKDALKFLTDQAIAAHTAVIKPPCEPEHVYFIRNLDGTLHKIEADVAPRRYHASSLADLAKLYGTLVGKGTAEDGDDVRAIAFVDDHCIQIVLDERVARRERLLLKLDVTEAVTVLRELREREYLKARKNMDQDELVGLLRMRLHGCVDKATIELFRSLKSTKSGAAESTLTQSTRGMARSVLIQASAAGGEVPDDIVVTTAIFEQFAMPNTSKHGTQVVADPGETVDAVAPKRYAIRCGVVMNVEDFTFTMVPLAGELEQACLAEEQRIAEELRFLVEKNNCIVVCGSPS